MDPAVVLKEARKRSGLTIRQLAVRAKTSHSAVAAYESGAKAPNTRTFLRLIRACGFEIVAQLRPLGPFENRAQRGRELGEVLDLAERFPTKPSDPPMKRWPTRRR
ncbi:MAG: helix-turn-helix domain-containing protein [Actinomycetota bacterium]